MRWRVSSMACNKTIYRKTAYVATAVLAFLCGVAVHLVYEKLLSETSILQAEIPSASEEREANWHKLFEAAMMTGDAAIQQDMTGRFQCMGADYRLDARLIFTDAQAYCVGTDGRISLPGFRITTKDEFRMLLKTHASWALDNLSFVAEVGTADKAKAYVYAHRP